MKQIAFLLALLTACQQAPGIGKTAKLAKAADNSINNIQELAEGKELPEIDVDYEIKWELNEWPYVFVGVAFLALGVYLIYKSRCFCFG